VSHNFSPELVARIEELKTRYPDPQAVLLPALHLIQKERDGWLSDDTVREASELLGIADMHIKGVVGFYDMFHDKPVGKHVVRLCKTLSCKLRGADDLRRHIEEKYGVSNGQTTQDGRFTFKCFECLGHCSTAPMMLVDEEKYENLTPALVDEVLEGLS